MENSASTINGTVISTTEFSEKRRAKSKEIQKINDATNPSLSTNPKKTTSKTFRSSKSVEQDDFGISLSRTNSIDETGGPAEAICASNKTVNNGPRRRNSKINEDEDTTNSNRERGEIRHQAKRSNSLPNSNLSKHLRAAAKSLKLKMDDISKAAEKVNKVIDIIIKSELFKSNPLFKSMEKMSTGSYYEGLKISNPNEFDIMLKIKFESYQTIELTSIDESGAFYTLAFKKRKPAAMDPYIDNEQNILAKYILDEFRTLINNVLQQSGKPASLEKKDPSSPAVTLTIPNEPENISVDLVLALQIRQWPEKASNGMNIDSWLGTKEKQKYRKEPCYMVAKQANPGKKDKKDTWRISFSNIEKDILSHHGSAKTCCERQGPMCCRKLCLKLMKYILKQLKSENQRRMNQFCSYHAKTALLHTCTLYPKDEDWKLEDLDVCFNRYVESFLNCLRTYSLSNFFIPSHNLFSSDYIDKSSCKYLFEKLESEKTQNYPIFLSIIQLSAGTSRLSQDDGIAQVHD
ncbi:PREDICTED: cyclic GMP-AMP synthase-like [Nanorana parkeri]|uniref:cyclic GMP-AMP synthase-like n=1 Tax=Nanorana parkeri TaxID=125878 RepID=UPI00085429D1|nr:PREDICTED: cyclic GMP-AMP synthase-like [Nanorana parkeri]